MVTKVKMPKLAENDEEQAITAWFKRAGDPVRKGEPLVEITTSKAAVEVEAPRTGVLLSILAEEKSSLPVGYVIALIGKPGEALPDVSALNREVRAKHAREFQAAPKPRAAAADAGALRATPAARRLARERGIDLARVRDRFKAEVITEAILAKYIEEAGAQ